MTHIDWSHSIPRPTERIARSQLPWFERKGYEAQIKKNGICLIVETDRVVTRKGKDASQLPGTCAWNARDLARSGATLACEGMPNGHVFVWDLLKFENKPLYTMAWCDRRVLLYSLWLPDGVILEVRKEGFVEWYDELVGVEDEGLVVRDPNGRWGEKGWIFKCRRSEGEMQEGTA